LFAFGATFAGAVRTATFGERRYSWCQDGRYQYNQNPLPFAEFSASSPISDLTGPISLAIIDFGLFRSDILC
jgi:hypothetical protein